MVELDLPRDATVADLVDDVLKRWPDFSPDPAKIVTAANKEYVKHTHVLEDGDDFDADDVRCSRPPFRPDARLQRAARLAALDPNDGIPL